MKIRPLGSRSVTWTLVAVCGPLVPTITAKVTMSPTLGVAVLTLLLTTTSARCGVSVALALLLLLTGSNWSLALIIAVLAWGTGLTTVAWICKVCATVVV